MSYVSLCRVCLASDIKMLNIANTRFLEIFEKLLTKPHTSVGRPQTVCYLCYSQLQRCHQFMDTSRKAEEILTQLSHSGIGLTKDTIKILDRTFVNKLSWTPIELLAVNNIDSNIVKVKEEEPNVKVEPVDPYMLTVKEEVLSEDENMPNEVINMPNEVINMPNEVINMPNEVINMPNEGTGAHIVKKEIKQEENDELHTELEIEGPSHETYYEEIVLSNPEETLPTPKEKHSCARCGKQYVHKYHLLRHLKNHRSKEYTCEICGKMFAQKCTLKTHHLRHTGLKKLFICTLCPAKFAQNIDLERHMRMHTGHKPFTCDICQQTFSRKSNMKLHIMTHYDSRPFHCDICKSAFGRKYDLTRHVKRKHICEKPYACELCDFRSVNASYVKYHVENKHNKIKNKVLKTENRA